MCHKVHVLNAFCLSVVVNTKAVPICREMSLFVHCEGCAATRGNHIARSCERTRGTDCHIAPRNDKPGGFIDIRNINVFTYILSKL